MKVNNQNHLTINDRHVECSSQPPGECPPTFPIFLAEDLRQWKITTIVGVFGVPLCQGPHVLLVTKWSCSMSNLIPITWSEANLFASALDVLFVFFVATCKRKCCLVVLLRGQIHVIWDFHLFIFLPWKANGFVRSLIEHRRKNGGKQKTTSTKFRSGAICVA